MHLSAPLAALLVVFGRRAHGPPELREELPGRCVAQGALRGVGAGGDAEEIPRRSQGWHRGICGAGSGGGGGGRLWSLQGLSPVFFRRFFPMFST